MPAPVTTCLQRSPTSSLSVCEIRNTHGMSHHKHMQAHEREERHRRTTEALTQVLYYLYQSTVLKYNNRCRPLWKRS